MKSVKKMIREQLEQEIERYKARLSKYRKALKALEKFRSNKARYLVSMRSLWADCGEKSFDDAFDGTLARAIENAEQKFTEMNNRSDCQASYSVSVMLEGVEVQLPREYWEPYIMSNKGKKSEGS